MRRGPSSVRGALPALLGLALLVGVGAAGAGASPGPPGNPPADPLDRLSSPDARVRARAASDLGRSSDLPPPAVAALREARRDPEGSVQQAALEALASQAAQHPEVAADLVEALADREVSHRRTAASALARLEPGVLATRVVAILERLDARDADVVAVLAPALLRYEPAVPVVLPVLVRSWRLTHLPALEPAIAGAGQAVVPHLAAILDDPDPKAREAVAPLLWRIPADALVREAGRLVPILVERLPTEPPRFGGSDLFTLLMLLGPEVPDLRARTLEVAATWLRALDPPTVFRASNAAVDGARSRIGERVESIRLLLDVVLRWWEASLPLPASPWRPWDSWFATLLPLLPDPAPEAQRILAHADEATIRTVLGSIGGSPGGEAFLRTLLASSEPSRRRMAVQACRGRDPSPETRLGLLGLLRDPDEPLREAVLEVLFAARSRLPGGRPEPDRPRRTLSDVERAAVLDVLGDWLEGSDASRRMRAFARLAELGEEAKPIGPVLARLLERTDVRGPEWCQLSYVTTRVGAWDVARPLLLRWRDSPDVRVRAAGVAGLAHGHADDPAQLVPLTRALLDSEDAETQALAVEAAVALGPDAAPLASWFLDRSRAKDVEVASRAVTALAGMGLRTDEVFGALVAALERPEPGLVRGAAAGLAGFGARAVPALAAVAARPGAEGALWTLGGMAASVPEARQAMEALASSPNPEVSKYAKSVLRGGGGAAER